MAIAISIAVLGTTANGWAAHAIHAQSGTLSTFADGSAGAATLAGAGAPFRPAAAANAVLYLPLVNNNYNSAFGTLANGGIYVAEGGVGLGALAASLSAPVSVAITQTTAPTLTMPSQVQVLSGYYQVSASSPVSLSTDSPLILAFPVPTGVDTAHLALAIFVQNDRVLDGIDSFLRAASTSPLKTPAPRARQTRSRPL